MLGTLHAAAFWATAALTVALALLAAWDVARGRLHRLALDRLVLGVLGAAFAGGVSGVALFVGGGRPTDPLHLLYGIAAPLVIAVARSLGARPESPRRQGWLLLGALVLGGVLLRLSATGG